MYTPATPHDNQVPILEKFICQSVSGLDNGVEMVSCVIRQIRSDGAGKFTGREYNDMLTRVKTHAEYTVPYTHQQNGRVERQIQALLKSARALRLFAFLPYAAWGELVKTAAYLKNLFLTMVNRITSPPWSSSSVP